jgi:hypothetical protein
VRPTSTAVYRRRRLVALLAAAGLVVLFALVARACTGEDAIGPLGGEDSREAQFDAEPVELTIAASGDLLIHSPVFARALEHGGGSRYDFAPMFSELRPYVEDADIAFCHVEGPMTEGEPTGYPLFAAPTDLADSIAESGWDACSTASNHSVDQGQEGIDTTRRALERAGVENTGSFSSAREQKREIPIVEADGVRVALLAYTTDLNGLQPPAPWSVNLIDGPGPVLDDAREARKQGADVVVVNLHWGSEIVPEYVHEPSEAQERLARAVVGSPDVTAVIGQGPHVVQSIERFGGKPVVFSEGNLVSNQGAAVGLAEASQDGLVALLDVVVDGDGARVEDSRFVPVWVSQPDYEVLPVGAAIDAGQADLASLEASYERTVEAAGRTAAEPVPPNLD